MTRFFHRRRLVMCTTLFLLLCCVAFYYVWVLSVTEYDDAARAHIFSMEKVVVPPPQIVLFLTQPHLGGPPLWFLNAGEMSNPFRQLGCQFDNCVVTSNREYSSVANLLIFRGPFDDFCCASLPDGSQNCTTDGNVIYIIPKVEPHNAFLFYQREAPSRTKKECLTSLDDVVNYTWTYKAESNIVRKYGSYSKLSVDGKGLDNFALPKSSSVLWYVSNCAGTKGARDRYMYALELAKHIDVDIYGRCSHRSDGCSFSNVTCLKARRAQYAFYLAFENSICKEYITEKFFEAFRYGNIPIVRGLSKSEYQKFAPPNSFIHVEDFASPLELARYLRQLAAFPNGLLQYHAWRSGYSIHSNSEEHCKLCEIATLRPSKTLRLSEWWNGESECTQ